MESNNLFVVVYEYFEKKVVGYMLGIIYKIIDLVMCKRFSLIVRVG